MKTLKRMAAGVALMALGIAVVLPAPNVGLVLLLVGAILVLSGFFHRFGAEERDCRPIRLLLAAAGVCMLSFISMLTNC